MHGHFKKFGMCKVNKKALAFVQGLFKFNLRFTIQ